MLDVLIASVLLALLAFAVDSFTSGVGDISGPAHATDGASLVIAGQRIRLEGIDAPELAQSCMRDGRDYACGLRSREALGALVKGEDVSCQSNGVDRYGRILGYCTVADQDIASAMVRHGWAIGYGGYRWDEAGARRERLGLWAGSFDEPQDWRRTNDGLDEELHGRGIAGLLRDLWHRLSDWQNGGTR
jgi:endonuclease YncB( thermonuclease family)